MARPHGIQVVDRRWAFWVRSRQKRLDQGPATQQAPSRGGQGSGSDLDGRVHLEPPPCGVDGDCALPAGYRIGGSVSNGTSATSASSAAYWLTVARTSSIAVRSSLIRPHCCSQATRVTSAGRCSSQSWSIGCHVESSGRIALFRTVTASVPNDAPPSIFGWAIPGP